MAKSWRWVWGVGVMESEIRVLRGGFENDKWGTPMAAGSER